MAPPEDSSRPRLATGCRWGAETMPAETMPARATTAKSAEGKTGAERARMILFPEGAIKLQGTGLQILEQCDGERTFGQILAALQAQFTVADPAKIRSDITLFLEQLRLKRIVDY